MDSAVLIILLLILMASLTTGTYFISVCSQKGVWGLDPTLNKPVFIEDYERCGSACKFSINRKAIEASRQLNTFRRVTGIGLLVLAFIIIVIVIR